jgi:hypothetical protein
MNIPAQLKWKIKQFSNVHIQGKKPNIFIFSVARSGSTWLMEIIASQRGIKYIDEPLLMSNFQRGGPLPASWEFTLPHNGREEKLEEYFNMLIQNKCGVGSPKPFSRFYRFMTRRIVFKIFGCLDLMNWFEKTFRGQIVYFIRHPIATSLSRERYGRLPLFLENDLYCERYLNPELHSYGLSILKKGSELEKKVLDWCLQNLPPMQFLDKSKWLCLHYEDLVMKPVEVIEKMAFSLNLADKKRMYEQVCIASKTIQKSDADTMTYFAKSSNERDPRYIVSKWRSKVSEDEEKRAFEILSRFKIDIYSFGEDMPTRRL